MGRVRRFKKLKKVTREEDVFRESQAEGRDLAVKASSNEKVPRSFRLMMQTSQMSREQEHKRHEKKNSNARSQQSSASTASEEDKQLVDLAELPKLKKGETYAEYSQRLYEKTREMTWKLLRNTHKKQKTREYFRQRRQRRLLSKLRRQRRRQTGESSDEDEPASPAAARASDSRTSEVPPVDLPVEHKRAREFAKFEQIQFGEVVKQPPRFTAVPKIKKPLLQPLAAKKLADEYRAMSGHVTEQDQANAKLSRVEQQHQEAVRQQIVDEYRKHKSGERKRLLQRLRAEKNTAKSTSLCL